MGHHRETSAFVPVVPSRNMPHPMLYPGDIHPLLGLENRERNADGGKNTEGRSKLWKFLYCQVQVVTDKIIQ